MSTRAEIKVLIQEIWKRTDKDIDSAINESYKEMLTVIGHHKNSDRIYKQITRGMFETSLPASFLRIYHPVKLIDPAGGSDGTNSYPLQFITKQDYDFWEPFPDIANPSLGIPWAYTLFKNSLFVTSIPDRTYLLEINMGGEPVDLLEDGDELILSSTWDETVKAGALQRLFASVKLYKDSLYWQSIYKYGYGGNDDTLVGGLKLLQTIDGENFQAARVVKNNKL